MLPPYSSDVAATTRRKDTSEKPFWAIPIQGPAKSIPITPPVGLGFLILSKGGLVHLSAC
jgi:hypothetical protein